TRGAGARARLLRPRAAAQRPAQAARVRRGPAGLMTERVGFIGLGIMGSRMAANLRRAGFELVVWNRTAEKARAWAAEHGAEVAETPSEVGARCEVVITMVVDGAQVESVLLAEGAGAANAALDDALFVDMSTIGPNAARRIASRL